MTDLKKLLLLADRAEGAASLLREAVEDLRENEADWGDAPDPAATLAFEMDDDEDDDCPDCLARLVEVRRITALQLALQHIGGQPGVVLDAARQFEAYLRGDDIAKAQEAAKAPDPLPTWADVREKLMDGYRQQPGVPNLRAQVGGYQITRDDPPAEVRVTAAQVGT